MLDKFKNAATKVATVVLAGLGFIRDVLKWLLGRVRGVFRALKGLWSKIGFKT